MRQSYLLLVVIVSLCLIAGVVYDPVYGASPSYARSIDDAMLLMISSHTMSDTGGLPEQSNQTRLGRMQMINSGMGDRTLTVNEIAVYRDALRESCLTGKALITARYAGEEECIRLGMMEKECGKRTDWLNEQAEALERARRRRARYRGLGGLYNPNR